MENNRKILRAARQNNRTNIKKNSDFVPITISNEDRKAQKRQGSSIKNLANERLKRLRTALNEEVKHQEHSFSVSNHKSVLLGIKKPTKGPIKRTTGTSYNTEIVEKKMRVSKTTSTNVVERVYSQTVPKEFNFGGIREDSTSFNKNNRLEEMDWDITETDSKATVIGNFNFHSSTATTDKLFIIMDTNIFISHLSTIKTVVQLEKIEKFIPVIYVPWMVVEELDEFKADSLRRQAQAANKYIHKIMKENKQKIQGQTVSDALTQQSASKCPDDKILGCCLQLLTKQENMILVTDDINLRVKAQLNNIDVLSHDEFISKINSCSKNSNAAEKSEQILISLLHLFTTVIDVCVEEAFGNASKHMDLLKTPPQSIEACLNIFFKYWFAVFSEVLSKNCKRCLEELQIYLKSGVKDLNEIAAISVRICVQMNDVSDCKNLVNSTIQQINIIKEVESS